MSRPLRILHLNSMLTGGGTDDQCVRLALGLCQLGQQAWVAGPDHREFSHAIRQNQILFFPTPPEGPAKLRLIRAVAQFIRRQQIQIVHGHHGRDLWPTILAARLAGTRPKVVLTRHMAKSPSSWFSRRFLLAHCDALIAVSQCVQTILTQGLYEPGSADPERRSRPPLQGDHSKISVVFGGIDTTRFKPHHPENLRAAWNLAPEHYAFALIGKYDFPRGKGQREFLQAAARIHQQAPNARFLIVGRGNMADILKQDIQQLGLNGKAWLTPYCHDMPAAMNAIDCLVHSALGTEAFGLVVCEAHACGKPVIASRLDGIPEAFAAGALGRLIEPDSVPELAAAMLEWAKMPPLNQSQRELMHAAVDKHFSQTVMAQNTLALYQRLLAR